MRVSKLFFIFLLESVRIVEAWNHASAAQFSSALKKNDITLVAFVAPWTEDSKSLEPEWKSAVAQSEKPLLSIDCVSEAKLCEKHEIISYPAIRLFRGDESVSRYRGPRKASSIVPFIRRAERPEISTLDKKSLEPFKSIDDAVFVAFLGPGNVDFKSSFTTLASRNHNRFSFGLVSDGALAGAENILLGCIVRYKGGEEHQSLCAQSRLDILQDFVEESTAPLIGEMTRRNELKFLQAGKSLVYIFAQTEGEREGYRTAFTQLAKKYQEYLNFVIIDAVEYAYMAPALGLKAGVFPALAVQNPAMGQVFPFDQKKKITPEAAEGFVLDIVQGNTKPSSPEQIVHDDL